MMICRAPRTGLLIVVLFLSASAAAQESPGPSAITDGPSRDELLRAYRDVLAEQRALRERIAAQDAKIAAGEARQAASPGVQFGIGPDGFFLQTRDGGFQLRLRSVVQADGRAYLNEPQRQADTFLIRRARLYVEGTIGDHFDYRLMPDFAGGQVQLLDAWVNLRFWKFFQIRGGKFKSPFSLERLQQEQFVTFNERSLVSAIAPDRDIGASVRGELARGTLAWDLAVLNGVADGQSADLDTSYGKDFFVRVFAHPFRPLKNKWLDNLGLGFAYSYGKQKGSAATTGLAAYKSGGQQTFFSWLVDPKGVTTVVANGDRWRLNPQLYAYVGIVGLLAEYVRASTDVTDGAHPGVVVNQAWNVQISAVLTGENAAYDGVAPRRPFGVKQRGPGAFELAARVNELRVDDRAFLGYADPNKSARRALAWALQLNWYLSRNFRFGLMYERTIFDGGAASGGFRPTENVLIGRLQASF